MNGHLTVKYGEALKCRPFVYVFLIYTVQDVRTVHYLGLYINMDSLTLTLSSFSQRYLVKLAQDNINVLFERI